MRRHMLRRGIATAMIAIMLLLSMDAGCISALAAEPSIPRVETTETEERATGYVDLGLRAPSIKGSNSHGMNLNYATNLPEEYDSRTKGYVTPIRNQNPWGTCWAFAACAAMESYALAHGLVEHPEDIDLSEYALAFLTFSDNMYYDMTGDETLCLDTEYYGFNQGGNDGYVFKTLSKWAGIYTEDGSYEAAKENGITPYVPKEENRDYILTGQYYLSMEDQDLVKQAIMDHGAVTAS